MKKVLLTAVMAAVMITAAVTEAAAATPQFGRTEEEWARLRDNTLEYIEIDDLIKEYNPTVRSNNHEMSEWKKTYGTTNREASDAYRDLAGEIYAGLSYPDASDPMYGVTMSSIVMSEQSAKNLEAQADNTLEDAEVKRLGFELAEKTLGKTARSDMISYYSNILNARKAELNVQLLSSQLNVKNVQAGLGMATQIDVLSAQESLMSAQQSKLAADASIDTVRNRLLLMCGWESGADAEIGSLPGPDPAGVDTIDKAADLETAKANNYNIRINRRKLENASSDSVRTSVELAIKTGEQNVETSLEAAYAALKASRDAYNYAVSGVQLQNSLLEKAEKNYSLGSISRVELESQRITAETAQIGLTQAGYALIEARNNYDDIVNGL